MIKQCQFAPYNSRGELVIQPLFGLGLEKTASAEVRAHLHPRIQDFVRSVRSTPNGIYILLSAMGAGEYWSSNSNGDLFPEAALIHSPENWDQLSPEQQRRLAAQWTFGYPTFLNAHPYSHHQNKDPTRAFGSVELTTWNPLMHRVELICYLDRALAEKFGSYSVLDRIDNGEYPDVSMGCKVAYDVCTICEHRSKKTTDYCIHCISEKCAQETGQFGGHGGHFYGFGLNRILPDGRKIAVRNDHPRFFDISFVFIGADKNGKVMAKIAQVGSQYCLGSFCSVPRSSAEIGEVFSKEAVFNPSQRQAVHDLVSLFTHPGAKPTPRIKYDPRTVESESVPERDHQSVKLAGAVKRQTTFEGLTIKVEVDPGEYREGKDKKTGKPWKKKMFASYGYIPKTTGHDGEAVDVYLRNNPEPDCPIFVVHQVKEDGSHDEDKVMLGYPSRASAQASYETHVPARFFGHMNEMDRKEFDDYLASKEKTASACSHEASCSCSCSESDFEKIASMFKKEKRSSQEKLSELLKEVPAGPNAGGSDTRPENCEESLPREVLDEMSSKGLGPALATSGMMGIVLKPQEFQRIVLLRMGEKPFAEDLEKKKAVFSPTQEVDDSVSVDPQKVDGNLKKKLMSYVGERSVATPAMKNRALRQSSPVAQPQHVQGQEPLLQKLSAAYNGYRQSLVKKAAAIQSYMVTDSQLSSELFGESMAMAFAGGIEKTASASVLGPESLAYLVGAFYQDRDFHAKSLAQTGIGAEVQA